MLIHRILGSSVGLWLVDHFTPKTTFMPPCPGFPTSFEKNWRPPRLRAFGGGGRKRNTHECICLLARPDCCRSVDYLGCVYRFDVVFKKLLNFIIDKSKLKMPIDYIDLNGFLKSILSRFIYSTKSLILQISIMFQFTIFVNHKSRSYYQVIKKNCDFC